MCRIENKDISLESAKWNCQKIAVLSYRDKAKMPINKQ